MALITANTTLYNRAHPKFLTSKPVNNLSTSKIISASMTNKNKPSVNMVAGMVRKISIGLSVALTSPIIAATKSALKKFLTLTPSRNFAPRKTAKALINNLKAKLITSI